MATQVPKHLLSRLLYPNPVCLLSVVAAVPEAEDPDHASRQWERNVMTISWLTPIDNHHTDLFVLNVPAAGMEDLILNIGGCSGADVDKYATLNISACEPGWGATITWPPPSWTPQEIPPDSAPRRQKKGQDCAFGPLVALENCVAHAMCRIEERQQRHGHDILFAVIEKGFVQSSYWDGRNFAGVSAEVPPVLTFLGSKRFGYTVPTWRDL
ncbi:hypothetical protein BC832DRAFT_589575 [Gaertneriomyces semiglobifer]|nr:hypothetical protein BC832DRAFT_589575 [Gaertneriomyces semiglobifer]